MNASAESSATGPSRPAFSFTTGQFALLLAALIAGTFPTLFLGEVLFYRDYGFLGYPFVYYSHEAFWRGELPAWNPLSHCGVPFLAQWGTIVFYPFSLIYLLLPLPWSLGIFCLAHLFLGGLGMFQLLKDWTQQSWAAAVGAVLFVFNGATLSSIIYPNYAATLAWIPWMVWLVPKGVERGGRWLLAAILASSCQMLTGAPEIILLTWILLLAVLLVAPPATLVYRQVIGRLALIVLGVTGLAAIQLLPFFGLLLQSQRGANFAQAFWSMPGWGWANFIVPLFYTGKTSQGIFVQAGQAFMPSYYVGAATLGLAVMAFVADRGRLVWIFTAASICSVVLALGNHAFAYPALRILFPFLGFARYPIKFVLLAGFTLPFLAAWGLAALSRQLNSGRRRAVGIWITLAALMTALILFAHAYPLNPASAGATVSNGMIRLLFFTVIWALLFAVRPVRLKPAFQFLVVILCWADLRFHAPRQNPTVPAWAFAPRLLQQSGKLPNPPRAGDTRVMISPRWEFAMHTRMLPDFLQDFLGERIALWSNLNLLDEIPKLNGAATLLTSEQSDVESLLYGAIDRDCPALEDFLGAAWTTASADALDWSPRAGSLPMVTSVGQARWVSDAESLAALRAPDWNPRVAVNLPQTQQRLVSVPSSAPHAPAKLSGYRFSAQAIEVTAEASQPSFLVIAQTYCRAWRAYLDGRRVPLLRANHAFQAVEIPSGTHQIQLRYRDAFFSWGAALSLATVIVLVAAWWHSRKP